MLYIVKELDVGTFNFYANADGAFEFMQLCTLTNALPHVAGVKGNWQDQSMFRSVFRLDDDKKVITPERSHEIARH